ncbi:MAG TPA: hypothetical protein VJC15_01920 [Candidatus Paceibacterota bacterium]
MSSEFPTHDEIWQVLEGLLDKREFSQTRKLTDALGVYLWEIRTTDHNDSTIEYSYMRKGRYLEGVADVSRIDRVDLDEQDNPIGGTSVAKFIGGRWVLTP